MIARALGMAAGLIARFLDHEAEAEQRRHAARHAAGWPNFGHDLRACGRGLAFILVVLLGLFSFGRFQHVGQQDLYGWLAAVACACLAFGLCRWFGNGRIVHGAKLWAASVGLLVSVVLFLQYAADTAGKLARHAFVEHMEYGALVFLAVLYLVCKFSLRNMEAGIQ